MKLAALPAPTADRLAKVCGLLASSHDGERAAAAAKASEMLRAAGWSWRDLVERGAKPAPPAAAQHQPCGDHRARAARLLAGARTLDRWERDFLASIGRRAAPLTEKQEAVLARLERDRAA